MKIGNIKGKIVEFGQSNNGLIYKNYTEFENKSNDICYIPEFGLNNSKECNVIDDDSVTYNYFDFYNMAKQFIHDNCLQLDVKVVTQYLFDIVDWQDPNTVIDEWCLSDDLFDNI